MPVICLFGPDGSGKSTLARLINIKLKRKGFRTRVSWMRGEHTFAHIISLLFAQCYTSLNSIKHHSKIPIKISRSKTWLLVEFFSAIPIILVRYVLPSFFGVWVVADRYIPDFIAWIAMTNEKILSTNSFFLNFLLIQTKRTHCQVYVTAKIEDLLERRSDEDHNFIKRQIRFYERLSILLNAQILNTSENSIDEALEKLSVSIA